MITIHRKRRLVALSASALLAASGSVIAARHFFRRTGEAAMSMIPAGALMAASIDTNPSPSQLLLFNKLRETFKSSGLNAGIDEMFGESNGKPSPIAELRHFVSDNYAFAWLGDFDSTFKKEPDVAVLVSLTDAGGAADWLKAHGSEISSNGFTYYEIKDLGNSAVMILNDYLVVAPKAAQLQKIADVAVNHAPSLNSNVTFKEARESLDADANFMMFMSPKVYQTLLDSMEEKDGAKVGDKPSSPKPSLMPAKAYFSWMAMGATVRDNGLKMDYQAPMDASKYPFLQALARIKPLDSNAVKALPTGAYMVTGAAQPGGYWNSTKDFIADEPRAKKEFDKGVKEFEKQTNLSVEKDIVPAFEGHATFAVYPDQANPDGYADALIYLTDENGGDPAALAEKVKAMIVKETSKQGSTPVKFTTTTSGPATITALDTTTENRFRKSMTDTFEPLPAVYKPAPPKRIAPNSSKKKTGKKTKATKKHVAYSAPAPVAKRGAYLQGKTVAWAVVGKSVILATSRPMLDRALAAAEGKAPSLASDMSNPVIHEMLNQGSQSWTWIGVGAILEKFRPFIEESFKDKDASMAQDILNIFGGAQAGIAASGKYDGKIATGSFFFPINWDLALQVGGKFFTQMKEEQKKHQNAGVSPERVY